ncbi:xyloglucan-specific endoglucanase [Grosmannia clavigera kw1407]|uniref:Xyloglucan-specific endoglucanase n=1 Tax=Grosmannia clavigera (strain kw1407 / UAMH 11150) TaxID=655863 RepID=F0XKF2_GROCL|nr:xyloglucan-specific endoglucanase [Grosmannia clavigera kw1407]EFX01637.1 xyloglucan-specific endoglucanase [Grosmannia clavigera kw1407]
MGILGFHFAVNFIMLAIPIGITLGILFGIDAHRSAVGESPIYSPAASSGSGSSGGGTSDGGGASDNDIKTKTYCDKSRGITPITKGQQYTLNPNQWGWNATEGGGLCMNVTTYDNSTYSTKTAAPGWSITWGYPVGPESQPVHAFPNIKVDGGVFPATIQTLAQIDFAVEWTYGLGNDSATTTEVSALVAESVNTNVAVDMFFDSNKESSSDSSLAKYEVMVWFADIGLATQAIGLKNGTIATEVVNGTTFELYAGSNSLSQRVLTWVAAETTETFTGDLLPLVTSLFTLSTTSADDNPSETDYLGYFAFGSETYNSPTEFGTFSVPSMSVNVTTSS